MRLLFASALIELMSGVVYFYSEKFDRANCFPAGSQHNLSDSHS